MQIKQNLKKQITDLTGITGITRLNSQNCNPIVNPGRFRVAIKGGPISSLGGNTKGTP